MMDKHLRMRQYLALMITSILLILACAWSVTSGEYHMSIGTFFKTLFGFGDYTDSLILLDFRMPRMLITILAGAALSLSGAMMQSITNNPLAEPGILGINAGSGFFIALFIVIGQVNADSFIYVLPILSVIGGILTALIIFYFSYSKERGMVPANMILVGIGLSAALSGGSLTLMSKFDKAQTEFMATWLAGNIWGDEWTFVLAILPWMIIIVPFLFVKANTLNILNTQEQLAQGLGVNVRRERMLILFAAVALSSAAVAVSGAISFIGLMGPHLAKTIVGPRHQMFMPLAVLIGSLLLVFSDTVGQVILQPSGIPAGIVVALIGAPYFLYLMYRSRSV